MWGGEREREWWSRWRHKKGAGIRGPWTVASVTATDAVKCDRNPLSRIKRKRENAASGLLIEESPVPAARTSAVHMPEHGYGPGMGMAWAWHSSVAGIFGSFFLVFVGRRWRRRCSASVSSSVATLLTICRRVKRVNVNVTSDADETAAPFPHPFATPSFQLPASSYQLSKSHPHPLPIPNSIASFRWKSCFFSTIAAGLAFSLARRTKIFA